MKRLSTVSITMDTCVTLFRELYKNGTYRVDRGEFRRIYHLRAGVEHRRFYDALNSLAALNLIHFQGKTIVLTCYFSGTVKFCDEQCHHIREPEQPRFQPALDLYDNLWENDTNPLFYDQM